MVSIIIDYWASFAAFLLFGALHSLGAQEAFKDWLAGWTSPWFVDHFWRLIYCLASYAALYHVIGPLHWGQNPDANIWLIDYPNWLWRVLIVLHLLSIVVIYGAFIQSDYLEFWGLKQAWRGVVVLRGGPADGPMRLFGTQRLVTSGLYRWVRHPMLVGGLLFLLTSGPSRNNLAFFGMYFLYMVVGAYYEERRLIRIFGNQYRVYQREVGAFIPRLWRRPG